MLDVRRLRLLCDLSHLGTIAAVAKAHTYTPSAVSQQLSLLEREAGVALLERTGRRVAFTPAGRLLVEHAETVLAALERTSAALASMSTGLSGPLRIGAFPTAVRTLLPAALVELGRRHPGLELMVTELDPVAVPAALRERRLDVGLLHDYDVVPVDPDPALGTVPLLDETVFLALPAAMPPAEPRPRAAGFAALGTSAGASPAASAGAATGGDGDPLVRVRDADWIMASPGTLCHDVMLQVCRAAGYTPRARHHADDFATVLALVAAGQGVSLVPKLAAAEPPAGVRLVPLPTRRRTRVAYRRGAAAHPAVAAFVSALRASTGEFLAR
ncbi:LysR family transcriptional regulator [Microbispora sp. RL4-1S]|uniref:LysR family transcriptional regulator n=1 Tax=Microbispora oryzae TaxID=2806554 RepID=A0A941ALJ3_9ACTN|nr:LysR substrate-binding domain-containing protein [Microbispora oryzae]MBP2706333.1 LysR family transcriptional regulator [Microbispora oryzae]